MARGLRFPTKVMTFGKLMHDNDIIIGYFLLYIQHYMLTTSSEIFSKQNLAHCYRN